MFLNLRKINFVFVALFFLNGYVLAEGTSTFEGVVKDPKGTPVKDAEVRVEGKNETIVAKGKTDANGHYVTKPVPAGTYKINVVINSITKTSLANIKTKNTGATRLDFALKADAAKRGPSSHRTGSNLW